MESHNHPSLHRAVPGRGDRRRRHPARRLHDGRAPDRLAQLAALRPTRSPADARPARAASSPASAATATASASRRSAARCSSTRATTATSSSTRSRSASLAADRIFLGTRGRRRQPGHLRRREDRPRRHPRRDDGLRRVRRLHRGEAPDRAGRRPVHGEAPARGLPRALRDGRGRRHPGHGRRGPHLLVGRDGGPRRERPRARSSTRCRVARGGHDAVRDPPLRVAGAHAPRRRGGQGGRRPADLHEVGSRRRHHRARDRHRPLSRALARASSSPTSRWTRSPRARRGTSAR